MPPISTPLMICCGQNDGWSRKSIEPHPLPLSIAMERSNFVSTPWCLNVHHGYFEGCSPLHHDGEGLGVRSYRLSHAGVGYLTPPLAASFGQTVTFLPS